MFVRVRPLNQSEKHQRSCSIVDTQGTKEGEKCTTLLVYKYFMTNLLEPSIELKIFKLKKMYISVVIKDKQSTLSATTKTFGFDRVFGPASKQVDVHKAVVGPLIKQVLQVRISNKNEFMVT